MAGIEGMLLQSARMHIAVRQAYKRIKRDPTARYFTYVLLLQRGKFYVGNSDNIYQRLLDHFSMTQSSAVWVREHGPVQRVVEISRNCPRDEEAYKTLEYMDLFGWENVRGGSYCRPSMRSAPVALADFKRDPARRVDYMSREEIDRVVGEVEALARDSDALARDDDG